MAHHRRFRRWRLTGIRTVIVIDHDAQSVLVRQGGEVSETVLPPPSWFDGSTAALPATDISIPIGWLE